MKNNTSSHLFAIHKDFRPRTFRSPALASGFLDGGEGERQVFDGGWFLTGDIGRMDDGGRITVIGRKALVILIAGHKVYANEVEDVLAGHSDVREAAVIGVPEPHGGQAIKAFLVGSENLSEDEVRRFCRARLPAHKRPRSIEFVAELAKTALGKIARDQLA